MEKKMQGFIVGLLFLLLLCFLQFFSGILYNSISSSGHLRTEITTVSFKINMLFLFLCQFNNERLLLFCPVINGPDGCLISQCFYILYSLSDGTSSAVNTAVKRKLTDTFIRVGK